MEKADVGTGGVRKIIDDTTININMHAKQFRKKI